MFRAIMAVVSIEELVIDFFKLLGVGLIFWLLWYLVNFIGLPEPFNKVAKVVLMVAAVFLLICVIMALIGHPIISI